MYSANVELCTQYACDTSNGQPPFTNSQLEHRPEYSKALGEPADTQVHSFAVMQGAEGESAARVAVPSCECLIGNDATRQGAVPPAHDPLYPVAGTCMEWDADCAQCQTGIDHRCDAPATVCNQSCTFISQPVRNGDQTHRCLPWSWVKQNCPGPSCPNATAIAVGPNSSTFLFYARFANAHCWFAERILQLCTTSSAATSNGAQREHY